MSMKLRISNNPNLVANQTLGYVLEVMRLHNPNILRLFNLGNFDNKTRFAIVTENGEYLTDSEISELEQYIKWYLAISDVDRFGSVIGYEIANIEWHYVGGTDKGIDFRADILPEYTFDEVRQNIQIEMSKYLDFRYWNRDTKIEWDELLSIAKNVEGVNYIPDEFFYPKNDENVSYGSLPRIKKFILRDLDGTILFNSNNNLTPVFYTTDGLITTLSRTTTVQTT